MSDYRYGAYGHIQNSVTSDAKSSEFAAVYIGTAPVHLIRGYADKGLVNAPVKLTNITAKDVIGYSKDWDSFTLCEALTAHFDNSKGNVGPIYVINVLDPAIHCGEAQEHSITFANGEAVIESDTIIIDTFAIEDKVENTDYTLEYNWNTGRLSIVSINSESKLKGTVACTYQEVDMTQVTDAVFRGSKTNGVYKGAHVIEKLYPFYGIVPVYVAAPGWTTVPDNYSYLCDLSYQINNHWFGFVYADIPISDANGNIDTFDKVLDWRSKNNYFKSNSKIYWPMAGINNVGVFHASTLALVEKMRVDIEKKHPCGTEANKSVPVDYQYFGEDSLNEGFDQEDANTIVQEGISTIVAWGGNFQLWGEHPAIYQHSKEDVIDKRFYFDANIIMLNYTLNVFQENFGKIIDDNITKALKDTITHTFREWLESLVADGALVGSPQVLFLESNNSVENMTKGKFVWNILQTNAPLLKTADCYAAYTDAGINSLFDSEEEE